LLFSLWRSKMDEKITAMNTDLAYWLTFAQQFVLYKPGSDLNEVVYFLKLINAHDLDSAMKLYVVLDDFQKNTNLPFINSCDILHNFGWDLHQALFSNYISSLDSTTVCFSPPNTQGWRTVISNTWKQIIFVKKGQNISFSSPQNSNLSIKLYTLEPRKVTLPQKTPGLFDQSQNGFQFTVASNVNQRGFYAFHSGNSASLPIVVSSNLGDTNQKRQVELTAMYILLMVYNIRYEKILVDYVQIWETLNNMKIFDSISFVDEYYNQNKELGVNIFDKFIDHMENIRIIRTSMYKQEYYFNSYVFPFLSDEKIKILLNNQVGRFLLRVSGSLTEATLVASSQINNDVRRLTITKEEVSNLTFRPYLIKNFQEICLPNGAYCDVKKN